MNCLHAIFTFTLLVAGSGSCNAQAFDPRELALIREQATFVCETVREAKGSKTTLQIQGEVSAKLSGLAKKLTDLGISGQGKYTDEKFAGLSQDATAAALEGDRGCRERVFNKMFDRLEPPKDKKTSYLENKSREDMRRIQLFLRFAPVTVTQVQDTYVCQTNDEEANTREFRLSDNQLSVTNHLVTSGERCDNGPRARRETTRICTADLKSVDDVVQIWSRPSIKFSCLTGDCFKCSEQSRWKNKFNSDWTSDSREYAISTADLFVGGEKHVRDNMPDFKEVTRSFARLISSGSDDAFCRRYSQYCR